jgi:MoxR-like ATPase
VLFEDVPGVGKSMLARALSTTMGAASARVQCTPDMLPGDITGSSIIDTKTMRFVFRPGPVFANVLLVDEINRATPKTQSSLLEAMAEKSVSVDGVTHKLPKPFLVLATQNPVELAGTFPLPEAQLDRFMFKLTMGYPDLESERLVVRGNALTLEVEDLEPVITTAEVMDMAKAASQIVVPTAVETYLLELTNATREDKACTLGAGPRGGRRLGGHAQGRLHAAHGPLDDVVDGLATQDGVGGEHEAMGEHRQPAEQRAGGGDPRLVGGRLARPRQAIGPDGHPLREAAGLGDR